MEPRRVWEMASTSARQILADAGADGRTCATPRLKMLSRSGRSIQRVVLPLQHLDCVSRRGSEPIVSRFQHQIVDMALLLQALRAVRTLHGDVEMLPPVV